MMWSGEDDQFAGQDDYQDYPEEAPDESSGQAGMSYSSNELPPGALMTAKIPPSFDGRMSWFAFEELVRDWIDCGAVDKASRGPLLTNRLTGSAAWHKQMMNRELLMNPDA
eukprot:12888909-Prorocentrum_lima.AAC.1